MGDTVKRNALKIIQRLCDAGFKAFFVGGAVRDMVMGVDPLDYDITTDATPGDIDRLFRRVIPVGEQFGVSLVVLGGKSYEVARFRIDGVYTDGRRPAYIEPSTELQDVRRRDFTINAILYDPIHDRVIDYVDGQDDIRKKIIRTVGDPEARFAEDRLRMLRAVRFAAKFNFTIETETFKALQHQARHILEVSRERTGDELIKMFTCPHPDKALSLLDESGLLEVILPEVAAMKGIGQPAQYHPEGDVYEHTRYMLELFGGGSVTLAFGILLHDVGKPVTFSVTDRIRFNRHAEVGAEMAESILRRFRFSHETAARIRSLVENHMRFINVRHMKRSTLRRFMALDGFDEMLELFRLDCLASHKMFDSYNFVINEFERKENKIPEPLLKGEDLISLGYTPGPLFGNILGMVMDAQLEGMVSNRDEALSLVLRKFPPELQPRNPEQKSNPLG